MDRQWRPTPNPNPNPNPNPRAIQFQGNVCPTCSFPHFPFCPPPPSSSAYGYTPQPTFPFPNWPHQHPSNTTTYDGDRSFKRPRIDDDPFNFSDDERRLKLIRDHGQELHHHGFPSDSFPPPRPPPPPDHLHHNGPFKTPPLPPLHHIPEVSSGIYHPHAPQHNAPYHHDHNATLTPREGNQSQHKLLNGRVVHHPYPYPYPTTPTDQMEASRLFFRGGHPPPPLPSSPPPPLPNEPPLNHLKTYFSPPKNPPSLFPVPVTSSSSVAPSSYPQVPEAHPLPHQPYFHNKPLPEFSTGFPPEEHSKQYLGDAQPFSLNQLSAEKPKHVDASRLFRHPHRTSRPDHLVIILRGLPGSGKSYLAKMLRDLEVENGDDAPRIHSMDDYFMTEVEKVEDNDGSKSSSSGRNKKPVTKKVMEYCYEPEMEEAYRSSMLKAFKKTVEEGVFAFIIVDDRNLRVADFAQFWATAKRSGYEVYILEATYKDPVGCAARNVHGFTQEDIEKMAEQWEEAPSLYLQLDVKSLFHGDDLKESRIQEVDMDMEDDFDDALPAMQGREAEKGVEPPVRDDASYIKDGKRWDAEGEHPMEVRELGKSKWSEDFGEDDIDQIEGMKGKINALSGLVHQYGKQRKSVHWGDQVGKTGFSIGSARKVNTLSLEIGPGAGYNLKSNPLPEEDGPARNSAESKKHSIFQERIRAERESFKAVFDRRRQRIGGLDVEED